MKEYHLNYCLKFNCIAGECKHTCCAGWEMQIDEQSLSKYKNDNSCFCQTLKDRINFKKSKFKTDKSGRCAFLNKDGLCEIIINLGEGALCQVCTDHPRFRSFFNDRIETGLGFCCEEATRIILSFEDKIQPVLVKDDGKEQPLDFNQKNVLEFRENALDILQDCSVSINDRVQKLLLSCRANLTAQDFKRVVKTFVRFERLDGSWNKRLKSIAKKPVDFKIQEDLGEYCLRFLTNGLYRHLSSAEDTMWVRARTVACLLLWWVIQSIILQEQNGKEDKFGLVVDVVRACSSEVEYSQKNLDRLYEFAYDFIKI